MRTKNSFLNILSNTALNFSGIILTFIVRTIFIRYLGSSYLGLNGLLTNVLSMLSIAELGFGTAVTFSLYKPLANNDTSRINSLMSFYKRVYSYIGTIIFILGIALSFALKFFIKDYSLFPDIKIIYFLYLANTIFWYFLSYKEVLIIADQKNYKLTKINFIFKILTSLFQIGVLYFFQNFILYLIVQIILTLIQRIITNRYITKQYKDIDFKNKYKLEKEDNEIIKKNVKATLFHKIGKYLINGTDNIILSSALSISIVGLYSNYLLIMLTLDKFIYTVFDSIVSSVGNLIAISDDEEKKHRVFKISNFMGFIFYGFSALTLLYVLNNFIELWLGKEYIFNNLIVLIIVLNFYLTGMSYSLYSFKAAAGVYDEDKFVPIAQAAINLIFSILLVKPLGILGVLLGTLISIVALPIWNKPYIVYKYVFKRSSKEYFIDFIKYFGIILVNGLVLYKIFDLVKLSSPALNILFSIVVVAILFFTTITLVFKRKEEFQYIKNILFGYWKKILKK